MRSMRRRFDRAPAEFSPPPQDSPRDVAGSERLRKPKVVDVAELEDAVPSQPAVSSKAPVGTRSRADRDASHDPFGARLHAGLRGHPRPRLLGFAFLEQMSLLGLEIDELK